MKFVCMKNHNLCIVTGIHWCCPVICHWCDFHSIIKTAG